ncbi:hypothetical protein AMELA_G00244370 [Ameiurus melas]|uniref:SH3 and cysteine-rich domain-containing protein 2 n=1 Tax=Ameiurus melas TaxID=219545 RepID=A0A7J5ZSN6_AMEME|nr:hypothetical protein AMELA_G00244370 [Ameiurus melas]
MRSKSVENFFQRSYSDARLPSDVIDDAPPPSPPLLPELPLPSDSNPPKPSLSPSLLVQQKPRPAQTHCFLDYVFRRPTSCQLCKHVIVGNSKQGLRCRTCKISAHLWCTADLSQQPCQGKAGMFKRNFSTPSIISDQPANKEAQTTPEVKGKSGDRVGFFPAKFVQRVRPGETVWRVTQDVHGDRQMGHMTVKEDQICVGKKEDSDGYVKLCSGKKRGLVPTHSLEEI